MQHSGTPETLTNKHRPSLPPQTQVRLTYTVGVIYQQGPLLTSPDSSSVEACPDELTLQFADGALTTVLLYMT